MYSVHSSVESGIIRNPRSNWVRAADVPSSEKPVSRCSLSARVDDVAVSGRMSRGKGDAGWR